MATCSNASRCDMHAHSISTTLCEYGMVQYWPAILVDPWTPEIFTTLDYSQFLKCMHAQGQ